MVNKIVIDTLWTLFKMQGENKECIDMHQQTATPEFMDGLDFLSDIGVVQFDIGDDPNVVQENVLVKKERVKKLLKLLREWEKEDKDAAKDSASSENVSVDS